MVTAFLSVLHKLAGLGFLVLLAFVLALESCPICILTNIYP